MNLPSTTCSPAIVDKGCYAILFRLLSTAVWTTEMAILTGAADAQIRR